jgi:hypothetical protein
VRSILDNRRYTGHAVFGRWKREDRLADPDDVAAGHVTRFRRADPDQVVRSRTQAHRLRALVRQCSAAARGLSR